MKIERNFKIPLLDLRIGDSIRIKNKFLFSFREKDLREEIEEYLVLDKRIIHNLLKPNTVIILLINERARIEELRATEYNCIELASWHFRSAVPVYAKHFDELDYLAPWADERGAKIVSITNRYGHGARDIVYEQQLTSVPGYKTAVSSVHSLTNPELVKTPSHYQLSALFDDILYSPTKLLPKNITENLSHCSQPISDAVQQYGANLSLLLESFSLIPTVAPCGFRLGSPCQNHGTHSNGNREMCIECLKKVALISVYGGSRIISAYNLAAAA